MEIIFTLYNTIKEKKISNEAENTLCHPLFFRLKNKEDKNTLTQLLEEKPFIKVSDTIYSQLRELIKSARPHLTLKEDEIKSFVEYHIKDTILEEYGVWVYYPWSEKIVHILDEKEFIELRTNRNKYKITEEEEDILSGKKVGVIGLSVGQSVSLTLAMERSFGELRIADFDELDITNLNRLRSGIHNIGVKKTILVAREIAELDPFLKVTCFHDGITEDNLDSFLIENGKLDVLIDECDGVDVKINCRIAARKHLIPVLMEASDRGTIDIERFDLEPDRPILHGYVDHLDISKVKGLKTNEEKLPFILPFVGIETMSTRLKASAIEVGQSISTWPQLASAVTMGGGITADVCRRLMLNQLKQSGRFFIDIEELISSPKEENPVFHYPSKPLTESLMAEIAKKASSADKDSIKDETIIKELVSAAAIAPSAGNNQPWKWYFDNEQLHLFHDQERSLSFGDFQHMASYMAFGTAIENLKLKAAELNVIPEIQLFPLPDENRLIATISLKKGIKIIKDDLVSFINTRCTNRNLGSGEKLNDKVISEIKSAVSPVANSSIKFIEDKKTILKLADILGRAEKLRLFIPQGHYDLFEKELRWTPEIAEETKDGLDIRTLDLSAKDEVGFRIIKDPKAIKLVNEWNGGKALENMTRNLVLSASAIGVISMPSFTKENCVKAGQAAERVWLTASKNSVSLQPILAPILHFTRLIHGNGEGMTNQIKNEFQNLNTDFRNIFNIIADEEPLFLFRLFNAENSIIKSLRLDMENIFFKRKF